MKKIYISPKMDVIELKDQQMLLAGSVNAPVSDETQSNENALAPEYIW